MNCTKKLVPPKLPFQPKMHQMSLGGRAQPRLTGSVIAPPDPQSWPGEEMGIKAGKRKEEGRRRRERRVLGKRKHSFSKVSTCDSCHQLAKC